MRLRPYRVTDYSYIAKWIADQRSHVMWCARLMPYPLTEEVFHGFLRTIAEESGECGFVMSDDTGAPLGFCVIAINDGDNSAFVRTIVVDSEKRGQGLGCTFLQLIQAYVFDICNVDSLHLNVFDVNPAARRCYEKAGFIEDSFTPDAFDFGEEKWGRVHMIARP